MFYETANGHSLPHDPFKAIVSPRPIGWISTKSSSGAINLAPYSFFNAVSGAPPIVMFSSQGEKDTVHFAKETGVFACNFVSHAMAQVMNDTSAPIARGQSEFDYAGLEMAPCHTIDVPHVKGCPAVLECVVTQIINPVDRTGASLDVWTVFGEVTAVHIDERFMRDGRFDVTLAQPVARLGYQDFSQVETVFALERPTSVTKKHGQ